MNSADARYQFWGVFQIFFAMKGPARWMVVVLLLLASFAEGIGVSTLLPLLSLLDPNSDPTGTQAGAFIVNAIGSINLNPTMEVLVGLVIVGILLKAVLKIIAMRYVGHASAEVATKLRSNLIKNLMKVSWGYFTRQPIGRIANAVSLEASRSAKAYELTVQLITSTLETLIYLALAFLISWKLALFAIGIGLIISLSLSPLIRTARRAGKRQTRHTRDLVIHLSDALVGIKAIKAMHRQDHFANLFRSKISELRKALRKQVTSKELMHNLQEPIFMILVMVGFYFAVTTWSTPIAELIVMGFLLKRLIGRVNKLPSLLQDAAMVESAYWSIHSLISESGRQRETFHGSQRPSFEQGCELKNIDFSYGDKPVLQDVSITIPAKQVTVILGTSGVGKTTLTDILLGLYRPDAGEIEIDGVPIEQIDIHAWRSMIGYVPQDLILFHDTIAANITLGDPSLTTADVERALKAADAWDFVSAMEQGAQTTVGERGIRLSGGQRQRIALARALVHKPSLLILDEVTSALDPETELAICRNIRALSESLTVLAITHRPAWVNAADRVFELGFEAFEDESEAEAEATAL